MRVLLTGDSDLMANLVALHRRSIRLTGYVLNYKRLRDPQLWERGNQVDIESDGEEGKGNLRFAKNLN